MGKSISSTTRPQSGYRVVMIFGIVFALFGFGFLIPFFLLPTINIVQARQWVRTECTILSSEVERHRGSEGGSTYKVAITYRYDYRGETYTSDRYSFFSFSSSGYKSKAAIVRQHRKGTKAWCYVNPADPAEAVIYRGFGIEIFFGMIPLVFVLVGLGMFIGAIRWKRKLKTVPLGQQARALPTALTNRARTGTLARKPSTSGPVTLKPGSSRYGMLLGLLLAAAFWNGILSIFVVSFINDWTSGPGGFEIFMALFLIPFVLVGLGLIGAVIYQFLATFNPRPKVTVNASQFRLGEWIEFKWQFWGNAGRIHRLEIRLEGREEATYRRGTNTTTDQEAFIKIPIVEETRRYDIASGRGRVQVPADSMHSFDAPNNKITWVLVVHGEISSWPDVKEEFPLVILPLKLPEVPHYGYVESADA